MSAIFGILDLADRPIDPAWIKSMQKDLAHRGPDGQGLYQENSVILGNMLLQVTPESIYDKSPYEEGGIVITANARLDERDALMDRLNIAPVEREKTTDPVLLLRSYIKFGKDFVKDIYGDFTFAIWDNQKKELFCARDQVGVKPFLYYFEDNRFVFSTEIKAIVKLPFVRTEVDDIYLRDTSLHIDDQLHQTTWKNIFRLKPANSLEYNGINIEINNYWFPIYKRNPAYISEENAALELQKLLEKTIIDRMHVLGSIGVPLSGGLDSSTIACISAKKLASEGKKLITASSVLNQSKAEPDEQDEFEFIQSVLQQENNIDPSYIYHSDLGYLDNINVQFNQQFAPINKYHYIDNALYRQLQSKSVRRTISGYMGDDTVSNNSILPLKYLLLSGRISRFFKLIKTLKRQSKLTYVQLIKVQILPILKAIFLSKLKNYIRGIRNSSYLGLIPFTINKTEQKILNKRKRIQRISNQKNKTLLGDIWLVNYDNFGEDWDCGSSHHQLEITYPFADRRIIEFLLQLPVEHFYAKGLSRGLIRLAMIGVLPEKIRLRKDKGYYSPGFFKIFRSDISIIKDLFQNSAIHDQLGRIIDIKKMNLLFQHFDNPKKNITFDEINVNIFVAIQKICIWIAFYNFIINNKIHNNETDVKKNLESTSNYSSSTN